MSDDHILVEVTIKRRQHAKLFRWLDKNTPGWSLGLRPERVDYYYEIVEEYDFDEPEQLIEYLRGSHKRGLMNSMKTDRPLIWLTPEQGVVMKLFWEGDCQLYKSP
jgi:hypothetical protein